MKKFLCYFIFTFLLISFYGIALNLDKVDADQYPYEGVISCDSLVIYSDSSMKNKATELVYGSRITVSNYITSKIVQIKYDSGKIGYTYTSCINNVTASTLTTDQTGFETYRNYCDTMKSKGFIESYCPYLYYLHVKHPNWVFTPNTINSTMENATNQELEKVSLQTGNPNYYIYVNGTPLVNEYASPVNYYYINSSTISSFMDPRNSLFENTIFQFLNLEKNTDAINDTALLKISGEGNLKNYLNEFKNAANVTGINALHLMARSKQEGANTVGYSATSGLFSTNNSLFGPEGKTLDGFYNFYNIGAYVDKKNGYTSSVQRGLSYAAGYIDGTSYNRPWNTPEKAVSGGGEWIGNLYVKKGQNTNFFQKFNISNYSSSSMFTHQYMTNAYAPTSESITMKNAYVAGSLIDSPFEFIIPVYQNMQELPYQAVDRSDDSTLSSITIDGSVISGFEKLRYEYEVNAVTNENYIDLNATTSNGGASVSGTGRITFTNNVANAVIKVIAEDGISTTSYTVKITKVSAINNISVDSIVSKMGVKISGSIIYGLSPGTQVSTLINNVTSNQGSASVVDSSGNSKTGNLATGDKIIIKGTSETKEFIISIKGDTSGDGVVKINDLILIQSHILGKKVLANENYLAGDTSFDGNVKINDLILVQSHILGKGNL